jgi:hypothetical protein
MALNDILAQAGDGQDFVLERPAGNGSYVPTDILLESGGTTLIVEVPLVTGGGGNIFIMSE